MIAAAQGDGRFVAHHTLTAPGIVSPAEVRQNLAKLERRLRRFDPDVSFAVVIECSSRWLLHAHLLTVTKRPISERLMREWALRSGFGPNLRTRRVGRRASDRQRLSRYLVKSLRTMAVDFGVSRAITFSRNVTNPAAIRSRPSPGRWLKVRFDPDRPGSILATAMRAMSEERRRRTAKAAAIARAAAIIDAAHVRRVVLGHA